MYVFEFKKLTQTIALIKIQIIDKGGGFGMKLNMDTIQFEYRQEVQELMKVIDKYVKQNPDEKQNKILEDFFDKLDMMDFTW